MYMQEICFKKSETFIEISYRQNIRNIGFITRILQGLNEGNIAYGHINLDVNMGSVYGLLPDGIKPLPEPMLTYHQKCSVVFT